MKPVKSFFGRIGRLIILAACGALSVFLLMSGYESIYDRSLPLVHTVDAVDLRLLNQTYPLEQAITYPPAFLGTYGQPKTVKIPGRSARIDIIPAIHNNQGWLARANGLHMLVPRPPREGNIGVLVLYCRANIQTFTSLKLPAAGSNIFIDTDHEWRYLYKITHTTTASLNEQYVIADNGTTGKLVIGCIDDSKEAIIIIEALLVAVQGIDT